MESKISEADMVELLTEFIKQMQLEGYSSFYIGKMCALVIHANDLIGTD